MSDAAADWSRYGFIEMVAPIVLPKTAKGDDDVRVWLKLPPNGLITAHRLDRQDRFVLDYPIGTVAARIEARDGRVADARGTEIGPGRAEWFFVYRPVGGRLEGVRWRRDDALSQATATDKLVALVSNAGAAAHLRAQNDCVGCHRHERLANSLPAEHGVANRATDARGFFQVQTVLTDEAPLEAYKPVDPNLDTKFVAIRCGPTAATIDVSDGRRRAKCGDGLVPVGEFDTVAALAEHDPHAIRVCDARRALFPHLDWLARQAFAPALRACGIESP